METRNKHGFVRKALLTGLLGLGSFAFAGCSVQAPGGPIGKFLRMGWPEGITPEAHEMGNFWVWTWVVAWIVGIIMWGLFFWCLFRFSAKRQERLGKGEFPRQTGYNIGLELVLTCVPVLIVMGLFFFSTQTQDQATALDKDPKVTVDVTAFQWNWKFGYGAVDASLSPTGTNYDGTDEARTEAASDNSDYDSFVEGTEEKETVGTGAVNGRSKSDLSYLRYNKIETLGTTSEIPVLVLPSHTAIEFDLAAADVVHSFWVPEFLFKRDVFPYPEENKSQRRFQITEIEKEGAFVGRCAEMCGTYHAMMNFEIRVVSPEKFTEYLKFRMDNPNATNSEALASIGEAPYATSTSPFKSDRTGTRSIKDGDNVVDLNS
ncbi:MAG: cytochrome c oxidase subunit II [Corynebacterium sp.]|nr:cytochrome c oxidase subunit II [Corynebacterium sp.]